MYALAAVAVLVILVGIYYAWNRRTNNAAQAALGKAIETSQAAVTDSPLPPGSTQKTFKTEKERADAAISEFQAVADKYGNPYQEKAKYFIAVNKLIIDRAAAVADRSARLVGRQRVPPRPRYGRVEPRIGRRRRSRTDPHRRRQAGTERGSCPAGGRHGPGLPALVPALNDCLATISQQSRRCRRPSRRPSCRPCRQGTRLGRCSI